MAKLTAWLVTLIGIVYLFPLVGISIEKMFSDWIIALSFLTIGLGKLMRNYSSRGKKK